MIVEQEVTIDGSPAADIEKFWFFFEKIADTDAMGEQNSRAIINYLREREFQFY